MPGYCRTVLCCFATQNWPQGVAMQLFGSEFQVPYGDVGAITLMAHIKRRQQHEHGFTDEHYGRIAVTWRQHAQLNPDAQMKKPMTLDDYLRSRWVAEPLRLFDCCPNTDGGGACIVTSHGTGPRSGEAAGTHPRRRPVALVGDDSPAWQRRPALGRQAGCGDGCIGMAGVTPKDIDVAQFYDAFTPRVIHDLVAYGFCTPEQVGDFIDVRQPRPTAARCRRTPPAV